jgi:hypothetical protein
LFNLLSEILHADFAHNLVARATPPCQENFVTFKADLASHFSASSGTSNSEG